MSADTLHAIYVFANSGHHYTFIPLSNELQSSFPKLVKLCKIERTPWLELDFKWVRGRYGMDNNGKPGIWIVVESNIGSIDRGSIYAPERQVPETELPSDSREDWSKSPYAYRDSKSLPDDDESPPITISVPDPDDRSKTIDVAQFKVVWKVPVGEAIDVDLIIDFGNTRTVALALENRNAQDGKLAAVCHPIKFTKRGREYVKGDGKHRNSVGDIVDSWFVLHEPMFFDHEPPSLSFKPVRKYTVEESSKSGFLGKKVERNVKMTEYVPQMFVEISPCIMGEEARQVLGSINLDQGGNYTLSSPKRYAWDSLPIGKMGTGYWTMVLNRWNPKAKSQSALPVLQGSMLRFTYPDGKDWSIEYPPNEHKEVALRPRANPQQPAYPRKDAMSWAALSILELAYRQITSEGWRAGNDPFLPRRLRNVCVTFPSGWIAEESNAYKEMWQRAIDIFTLTHFSDPNSVNNGGSRPELSLELDEAVASQLPLVYSEIRRLGNIGENWIELYGRGKGADSKVRIMTIDIGGGTTDISVVEYCDDLAGAGVALKYRPIFKDSNSYAGDRLTKEIIERVLVPAFAAAKGIDEDHEDAEVLERVFMAPHRKVADKAKWSRIVKLVLLPLVRQWLLDMTEDRYGNPDTGAPWALDELECEEGKRVDVTALSDLNGFLEAADLGSNFVDPLTPIKYDPELVEGCIRDSLSPGLEPLAKYVTAFDVDLVSLSGKPSELPPVKTLLDEILPILPQRIVPLKNYLAGDWYPMSSNHRITDAKTVTAVGAALYSAIRNGLIDQWSITCADPEAAKVRNYWGLMPTDDEATGFGADPYLDDKQDSKRVELLVNSYVGRMRYLTGAARPEQQYKLVWKNPEDMIAKKAGTRLEIEIVRKVDPSTGQEMGLELGDTARALDGEVEVTKDDLNLHLCTLEGGEFWIDSGRFEIQW